MLLWWDLETQKPSPKTCAPVLCDSISYVEEVRAYLYVHKKHNTHRSMTSSPATFCRWGRGYAELRLNGVLRSSGSFFVLYRTYFFRDGSMLLAQAGRGLEPHPVEGGHLGAWGASGATGCAA